MRHLSKKQIKLIDYWMEQLEYNGVQFYSIDDFPQTVQDQLQKMNDYETLWQDANRYINDKKLEKMYKR